jgi:DNA-binding NtrC family response regulator
LSPSTGSATLLIVDDDEAIRADVGTYLRSRGYTVHDATGCVDAELAFRKSRPHLVIADYALPDGTALDLLPRIKRLDEQVPIVLLTAHGSVDLAVQAIKEGAEHFLTKPVAMPALELVVERALENRRNRQQQLARQVVRATSPLRRPPHPFLGVSHAIRQLEVQARQVLGIDRPIWLSGETGAGKGVLARWLHEHGPRAAETLVELNCAGLPRELVESELFGHEKGAFTGAIAAKTGLLEVAHRGTLLLDEIGDMELSLQPKLLKVLEDKQFRRIGEVRDRPVDAQLIAATHRDLTQLVRENKFRADLYFRISTIHLTLPPLRERVEDIPYIARDLLERLASDLGCLPVELKPDAIAALQEYSWPGNIRELRNVLERAVILRHNPTVLGRDDLVFEQVDLRPSTPGGRTSGPENVAWLNLSLADVERRHIEKVLRHEDGNVGRAAKRLGISRSTLYQRLKDLGVDEAHTGARP